MHFNTLAVSSLLVALAAAEPAPYQILGKMSLNTAFGLAKRQAGYEPTQTYCGPGTDCASSCGAGYVQCASSDDELHCFNPTIQQTCCPDGSGNSCDQGYYCTSDATGGTWCCPDGMSLSECAAAYSLTGVLVSETASATASTAAPTTAIPVTTTSASSYSSSVEVTKGGSTSTTVTDYSTTTTCPESTSTPIIYSTPVKSSNATLTGTKTATSTFASFTGGAERVVLGGFGGLAMAAGALLAF